MAVIGAGAFGRNHLRVYSELAAAGSVQLVAVVEPRQAIAATLHLPVFPSVEALLASGTQVDAASVCTPTSLHRAAALPLLAAGVDTLIEKPVAPTLDEADELIAAATRYARILQVGHLERFNPAVTAVRALLNKPMFFEAHRLSLFTPRSLDVDVVLDLMIHDLDLVLSLAGSAVREVRAVGLPVLSRTTDIANVRVEFESGCVANFTASRVSTERVRKLRFFQPHQYLSLDFARQDLLLIDVTAAAGLTSAELEALMAAQSQGNAHPTAGLSLSKVPVQPGEPLRLEIESFLAAVRTRSVPVVDGWAGRAALALALEINAAISAHARRTGLAGIHDSI